MTQLLMRVDPFDVNRDAEQNRFEDRLRNWCRVARVRAWQSARCWSAEGRYVPPNDEVAALPEEDLLEVAERLRKLDPWPSDPTIARKLWADAWLLEDCWRFMPNNPQPFRLMVAFAYHRPWIPPGRISLRLGVRRDRFDDLLRRSRAILRNRVRTFDQKPTP